MLSSLSQNVPPKPSEESIQELVTRAQKGEGDAFGQLYDIYIDQLFRYITFRVAEEDREDLTELVFLKAWESIAEYRRGTAPFSSWLFKIAHNIVVDHYRTTEMRRNATSSLSEAVPETRRDYATIDRTHRRLEREIIQDALQKIPEDYRTILILKYINDLSYEEIEHIMERGYAALRVLQYRALKALKKELSTLGFSELDLL